MTLRHYSHMWSGLDESIAEVMTGNVKIETASEKQFDFIGNQSITNTMKSTMWGDAE